MIETAAATTPSTVVITWMHADSLSKWGGPKLTCTLDRVAAIAKVESGRSRGKVVIQVSGDGNAGRHGN